MWQVLENQTLIEDPKFTVIKEKVRTNAGHEIDWYRLDEHDCQATGIIARNEEGKILLMREYTYPLQDWVIDFPGGGVPAGEDLIVGANRELAEEAGYEAATITKIGQYMGNRRRCNTMMHLFLATDLTPSKKEQDTDEEIEIFWATEQEIDDMIIAGQIISPRVLAGWTFYKLHKS